MKWNKLSLFGLFLIFLFASCHKDDGDITPTVCPPDPTPGQADTASAYVKRVNDYIFHMMRSCYLWNEQLPDLNRKLETDPKAYFKKLLVEEDLYSSITDDLEGLLNSTQGIEKTFGYSLAFQWADAARTKVQAIVEYVYPNSAAALAHIERGDIIVSLNDRNIKESDIGDLINGQTIRVGVSKFKDGEYAAPVTVTLTSTILEQNPVHTSKILDIGGTKTGYLFYTSYIGNFNSSLDTVFSNFKAAGVSELILDLRYNLGGDENAIVNLCSHIAPASACQNKDIIIKKEFNAIQEAFAKEDGIDNNTYYTDTLLSTNLDLTRVYILTSQQTYSASEVTIVGLQPYMEVIRIGERTGGKYTGMRILPATVTIGGIEYLDPIIGNWAVYPIILQYKNVNNENPKGGLAPHYPVESFYLPMAQLGDEQDALIAKAVELIGGQPPVAALSLLKQYTRQPFRYASSAFDEIKRNFFVK